MYTRIIKTFGVINQRTKLCLNYYLFRNLILTLTRNKFTKTNVSVSCKPKYVSPINVCGPARLCVWAIELYL